MEKPDVPIPVIEYLKAAGLELAVLFGSRATGNSLSTSDWDFGVISSNTPFDGLRASAELGRAVGGRVDVVDLRRAPPLLCMAAVREGKVLFDRTGSEFARFASLSLRRYSDTAKLREAQSQSLDVFVEQRVKP